jgi:hypothetical protein
MTDQELADAIRAHFGPAALTCPLSTLGSAVRDFLRANPQWQPAWGDKVRHGAAPEPRTYVAAHPTSKKRSILVDHMGATIHADTASLTPWTDEKPGYPE